MQQAPEFYINSKLVYKLRGFVKEIPVTVPVTFSTYTDAQKVCDSYGLMILSLFALPVIK